MIERNTHRVGGGVAIFVLLGAGAATALAAPAEPAPAVQQVTPRPSSEPGSDQSYYLSMRDQVRIAVSLWFPDGNPPQHGSPVLLIQTRYGRIGVFNHNENGLYRDFRRAGYVVAVIDSRGSTASFGPRDVELGPDEIADMDEIIHHLKSQPWSNGQIIAAGLSYMADTADMATGSPVRLTGAIVRESDFDVYRDLIRPGGVANDFMLNAWGADTLRRDLGRSVDPALKLDCALRVDDCPKLYPRLTPVDADRDFSLIRQAIAGRCRWTSETYADTDFFDDKGTNGYPLSDFSPALHLAEIRQQAVPVQYWGSWMDAGTADAAISRYRAAPNVPAQVIITANNHGGQESTDPFFTGEKPPLPAFDEQVAQMMSFASKLRAGEPPSRSIHYYVLGARAFLDTSIWPPSNVQTRRLFLAGGNSLVDNAATGGGKPDRYAVDFTATTGKATRWSTQIGPSADYPDRGAADARLITYTSAPLDRDMELVGKPAIDLFLSAATADPAIFVYLEDVAPDGRVTYLTEGELRAIDRKLAEPAELPYPMDPPSHTYKRADAMAVIPGEPFEARIGLFPVAALLRKGHEIRVSIAGGDADTFRRYSQNEPDVFTIYHETGRASVMEVPLRPWKTSSR